MRWSLTIVLALAGCSDDGGDENLRCEMAPQLLDDALDALVASGPACTRDDECVMRDTSVQCRGFEYGSCGTPLHRDARWDAEAVCREIEELPAQQGIVCSTLPSCVRLEPACVAGRCSAR